MDCVQCDYWYCDRFNTKAAITIRENNIRAPATRLNNNIRAYATRRMIKNKVWRGSTLKHRVWHGSALNNKVWHGSTLKHMLCRYALDACANALCANNKLLRKHMLCHNT